LSLPGFDFAYAINSFTDFAGTAGLMTKINGCWLTSVIASKPLTGSYESL
jgi:hypothetical protein